MNFLKKYHKWLSIIFALFIILFSISGILLNHRKAFSSYDIDRSILPDDYSIKNWNNAAVKSTLKLNPDSILIYGNIGVWLTDSEFSNYSDFNTGLPKGIDNRKISTLLITSEKRLIAGTFFGLFEYDFASNTWKRVKIPTTEKRIVDIIQKDNNIYILSRSHLIIANHDLSNFEVKELPAPENYDNKIGLFKTLWVIHSGEIYGTIGKIIVDIVGLIFIFLTVTGVILFINKKRLVKRAINKKPFARIKAINLWNLKWHNKIGWTTVILLIITTATGMFLRPPLIITVATAKVSKIPGTELDTPNPWFDKLRRILYDEQKDRFLIATLDGFYYSDDNFSDSLKKFSQQPPASIMGVNVFRKMSSNTYLVGSFEGLYEWNPEQQIVFDYIKKVPWKKPEKMGPPIGDYLVTGYSTDFDNQEIVFDYDKGAFNIGGGKSISMPDKIATNYRMSWWTLGLEIHTGRFFEFILGSFYILIIPLSGLGILFILISGTWVWWKAYRGVKY
jgi:hypothetical protein